MKKKILSFILAICLILPCAFMLTACGGDDKKVDLAGKTIRAINEGVVDWEYEAFTYYEEKDSSTYYLNWNLEQFVENVFNAENGKEYLEEMCYYSTKEINTLEEAKAGMERYVTNFMTDKNPVIAISSDLTEATTYAYSDSTLQTPLKKYSIQKDGDSVYELFDNQEQVGEIFTTSEGGIKCYGSIFQYASSYPVNSIYIEQDVVVKVPKDGGTENEFIEISLTEGNGLGFMLDGYVTYRIKK